MYKGSPAFRLKMLTKLRFFSIITQAPFIDIAPLRGAITHINRLL